MINIKKNLCFSLGMGLVSTFFVITNTVSGMKFLKEETGAVLENEEDIFKPNNFDSGERILIEIKVCDSYNKKNNTTEKDLVNYVMVISKVLYDNSLLNEEIINGLFDKFKDVDNLKLYCGDFLSIHGEEYYKKLKDVFAKTDFKSVELNEEYFKQTIKKIKEVLLKEKNEVEEVYAKLKKDFDNEDEKALVKCQNVREKNFVLKQEDRIKKYKLSEQENDGKFFVTNKGSLLKMKDNYEKRYTPKLKECFEKINNIKFEDVKDLHKNLEIGKDVKRLKSFI